MERSGMKWREAGRLIEQNLRGGVNGAKRNEHDHTAEK